MIIIGGIYTSSDLEETCFIPLDKKCVRCNGKKKETIYGIIIHNLLEEEFSRDTIEKIIIKEGIDNFDFWFATSEKEITYDTNGYLGQIDKKLHFELIKCLYQSKIWKGEENN